VIPAQAETIPREAHGFNQSANSFQTNPNKTKQNCLDFLGFIRPNRGFSKGYKQKNKKNDPRLRLCAECLKRAFLFSTAGFSRDADSGPANKKVARILFFAKQLFGDRADNAAIAGYCAHKLT
jgi:hypothetical protein